MPLAWSIFPVFSLFSRLLPKHYPIFWHPLCMSITTGTVSPVQSCSIHSFTHPRACGHSCAHTISAGTCVLIRWSIATLSSSLCPISPSFPLTFPPGPSYCGCVPGHATPCYNRKPPFIKVCSLSVFRWGSEPLRRAFSVHCAFNLGPMETDGKVLSVIPTLQLIALKWKKFDWRLHKLNISLHPAVVTQGRKACAELFRMLLCRSLSSLHWFKFKPPYIVHKIFDSYFV